jgi:hypothetical protein
MDWKAEARFAADYACEHLFISHRGAMPWRYVGVTCVFGNDYTKSDHTEREIEILREHLAAEGMTELGFAVDSKDGWTFAILVEGDNATDLNAAIFMAWVISRGGDDHAAVESQVFEAVAANNIAQHKPPVEASMN